MWVCVVVCVCVWLCGLVWAVSVCVWLCVCLCVAASACEWLCVSVCGCVGYVFAFAGCAGLRAAVLCVAVWLCMDGLISLEIVVGDPTVAVVAKVRFETLIWFETFI